MARRRRQTHDVGTSTTDHQSHTPRGGFVTMDQSTTTTRRHSSVRNESTLLSHAASSRVHPVAVVASEESDDDGVDSDIADDENVILSCPDLMPNLYPSPTPNVTSPLDFVIEVIQSQRKYFWGWAATLPVDPPTWWPCHLSVAMPPRFSVSRSTTFQWAFAPHSSWALDTGTASDGVPDPGLADCSDTPLDGDKGWRYGFDFGYLATSRAEGRNNELWADVVRQRRWIRRVVPPSALPLSMPLPVGLRMMAGPGEDYDVESNFVDNPDHRIVENHGEIIAQDGEIANRSMAPHAPQSLLSEESAGDRTLFTLVNGTNAPLYAAMYILLSLEDRHTRRLAPAFVRFGQILVIPPSFSGPVGMYVAAREGREVWILISEETPRELLGMGGMAMEMELGIGMSTGMGLGGPNIESSSSFPSPFRQSPSRGGLPSAHCASSLQRVMTIAQVRRIEISFRRPVLCGTTAIIHIVRSGGRGTITVADGLAKQLESLATWKELVYTVSEASRRIVVEYLKKKTIVRKDGESHKSIEVSYGDSVSLSENELDYCAHRLAKVVTPWMAKKITLWETTKQEHKVSVPPSESPRRVGTLTESLPDDAPQFEMETLDKVDWHAINAQLLEDPKQSAVRFNQMLSSPTREDKLLHVDDDGRDADSDVASLAREEKLLYADNDFKDNGSDSDSSDSSSSSSSSSSSGHDGSNSSLDLFSKFSELLTGRSISRSPVDASRLEEENTSTNTDTLDMDPVAIVSDNVVANDVPPSVQQLRSQGTSPIPYLSTDDIPSPRPSPVLLESTSRLTSVTPPRVGLCFSGGGYRAMISAAGFARGLECSGLMDSVLVMNGVSGGAWFVTMWTQSGSNAKQFKKILKKAVKAHPFGVQSSGADFEVTSSDNSSDDNQNSSNPHRSQPQFHNSRSSKISAILSYLKECSRNYDTPVSIVDVYSAFLGYHLLGFLGDNGLSTRFAASASSSLIDMHYPFPILSVVRRIPESRPHLILNPFSVVKVGMTNENMNFSDSRHPSQKEAQDGTGDLGLESGIHPYDWIDLTASEVYSHEEQWSVPMSSFGKRFDGAVCEDDTDDDVQGPFLAQVMGMCGSAFAATVDEMKRHVTSPQGEESELNSGVSAASLLGLASKCGVRAARFAHGGVFNNPAFNIHSCPSHQYPTVELVDAGVAMNAGIPSLLRPGRAIDIIIVFDSRCADGDKDVNDSVAVLRPLLRFLADHGVPAPYINWKDIGTRPFTVIADDDDHAEGSDASQICLPVIIYIPLVPPLSYSLSNPLSSYSFYKMSYTSEEFSDLYRLGKAIGKSVSDGINDVIRSLLMRRADQGKALQYARFDV